jgi:hypothetical protein
VFPLFSDGNGGVEYRLSDEALADESVAVEEVDESGSVPDLLVENKGDIRVLFLEGEELIGAKQNRILNTSVLVAAHSKTKIPVSCVEQGRWGYRSRYFGSSGSHSSPSLRRVVKSSVSRAIRAKRGHSSDQGAVWKEVACLHATHGVSSDTSAMSDAYDMHRGRIEEYQDRLKYVEGATGAAVAIGNKIVAFDGNEGGFALLADERLIYLTGDGLLLIANSTPDGLTPIVETQLLEGTTWGPPALCGGKLYVRNESGDLACWRIAVEK